MLSFELNETQEMIRQTIRDFAREEIAPTAIDRDKNGSFPTEIVQKLGELGFMGMMVSPEWGGSGLDSISYVTAMEEVSKVDASVGVIMSVNNSLVCWAIERFGSDEQKERFLRPLATGARLGAYCLSEPEVGSDAKNQHTTATRQDDGTFLINGTKNWITNGTSADVFLVFAQTDRSLGHKGITCFITEGSMDGFERGQKEDKLGIRSSDTCSLGFTNVKVGPENVLGEVGRGYNLALETLNGGRIGIAAQALGIAQGSLDAAVQYSKERKIRGNPLHKLQAIQFKIAEMAMKVDAARLLIYRAAALRDKGERFVLEASQAKLFASRTAVEVANEAVQIHGGYGYVREYNVERFFRDAKITEIYEGTSEIQHIVIAREVLKD